jgi:hypothetical protein
MAFDKGFRGPERSNTYSGHGAYVINFPVPEGTNPIYSSPISSAQTSGCRD